MAARPSASKLIMSAATLPKRGHVAAVSQRPHPMLGTAALQAQIADCRRHMAGGWKPHSTHRPMMSAATLRRRVGMSRWEKVNLAPREAASAKASVNMPQSWPLPCCGTLG